MQNRTCHCAKKHDATGGMITVVDKHIHILLLPNITHYKSDFDIK